MTKRSRALHEAAGWVLVTFGVVHSVLTLRRFDKGIPRAPWLLGGGILLVIAGLTNIAFARSARGDSMERGAWMLAVLASASGVLLAVAYTWATRGAAPQGLPLVMLFLVATVLTLQASPPAKR